MRSRDWLRCASSKSSALPEDGSTSSRFHLISLPPPRRQPLTTAASFGRRIRQLLCRRVVSFGLGLVEPSPVWTSFLLSRMVLSCLFSFGFRQGSHMLWGILVFSLGGFCPAHVAALAYPSVHLIIRRTWRKTGETRTSWPSRRKVATLQDTVPRGLGLGRSKIRNAVNSSETW